MVQSDKVIIDALNYDAHVEAALVFYESPKVSEGVKDKAFRMILAHKNILEELLKRKEIAIPVQYIICYVRDNKVYKHIIQHRKYTSQDLEKLLSEAFREDYRESIMYIHKLLGSDPRYLERLVAVERIPNIDENMLSMLVKLGVSLNVVGERIAFLADLETLKKLKSLGYSFDSIEHDLILEALLNSSTTLKAREIANLLGTDWSTFSEDVNKSIRKGVHYKNESLDKFVRDIFNGKVSKDTVIPDLYTNDYSWIEKLTPSMLKDKTVKKALKVLAHNKSKQILRRITCNYSNDDLLEWLRLSI